MFRKNPRGSDSGIIVRFYTAEAYFRSGRPTTGVHGRAHGKWRPPPRLTDNLPSVAAGCPSLRIVGSAISSLNPSGDKVLCTRRALHEALMAVAQEATTSVFWQGNKSANGIVQRADLRGCISASITPPWP